MTLPTTAPVDAHACPDCRAALANRPSCPACGLPLVGPLAQRLWEVDVALAATDTSRRTLLAERVDLLTRLRSPAAAFSSPATAPSAPATTPPPPTPVREARPATVQNSLLGLGGLLLSIAVLVFAAVTYDRLGLIGRAVVLLGLTASAAAATRALAGRGLRASAEAVAAVTLVLGAIDLWAVRRAGLGDGVDLLTYAAVATGLLAGLALLLAVPAGGSTGPRTGAGVLQLPVVAAVVLAQLPVPLLLTGSPLGGEVGTWALVLLLLAAADLALTGHLPAHLAGPARPALAAAGALWLVVGAWTALASAYGESATTGMAALVLLAALLAVGARRPALRTPLLAGTVIALTLAVHAASRTGLEGTHEPLVATAAALLALAVAALAPTSYRTGLAAGALAVAGAAALTQGRPVLELLAPVGWVLEPWSDPAGDARQALAPGLAWSGSWVALAAVLGLLVAVVATALLLGSGSTRERLEVSVVPASALSAVAAALLPLAAKAPYAVAIALLLAAAGGLVATRHGAPVVAAGAPVVAAGAPVVAAGALVVAARALAGLATVWSLASEPATLLVLPVVVVLCLATRRAGSVAVAGLLVGAQVAAVGAALGLAADQVGGLLLLPAAALLGLAALDRRLRAVELEGASAACAAAAVLLAVGDVGWLSWTLSGAGLLALATALRPDRRPVAAAGGLLLAASSWVRLADAGVGAPEPYVVPLGLLALALGHLRRRAEPATGSFPAYGPGLSLLLVPSLLASLSGTSVVRPLLLGLAALTVLLVGASARLRAPLALGGAVLAVDALHLLAPFAAALPRWLPLAIAGLLLVGVGATYEQRRQDIVRVRARFDALA